MENITKFFHNIVPGLSLILGITYLEPSFIENQLKYAPSTLFHDLKNLEILASLYVISASLLIGFLLQGIIKLLKDNLVYYLIFYLLDKFEGELIGQASEKFNFDLQNPEKSKVLSKIFPKKSLSWFRKMYFLKQKLFIMHDYIVAKGYDHLSNNFWTGNAFWSNIATVSLILSIVSWYSQHATITISVFLITMFLLSTWLFLEHLYTMFDIALKTFLMLYHSEEKDQ